MEPETLHILKHFFEVQNFKFYMVNTMTLEDFFTLTEMKNGLTTLARVEELICVMQKQTAYATSNVGDAARQWATAASTLASTENQDCLSHFVHLDGLCFLNQWLQEAVKYSQGSTDAEELINVLLGSLEKLPVDRKKLSSSGILSTIEKLFSHKTADIKIRAETLFKRWNTERINDDCCQDLEKGCLNLVESSMPSADAISVEDEHVEDKNVDSPPCQTAVEEGSCRFESGRNEKVSVDETSDALIGMASSSAPVSAKVQVKDDEECSTSDTKNHDEIDAAYDLGQRDGFCVLSSTGSAASSPEKKSMLVCSASAILESEDGEFNVSEPMDTNSKSVSVDEGKSKHMNEPILMECKDADELSVSDPPKTSKFMVTEESNKKSDSDLESGEFDALEVARRVAIEVEREVVDYREQSCSSSTNVSSSRQDHPISGKPNGNVSVSGKDESDTASSPNKDNCKLSEVTTDLREVQQSLQSPNHAATDQITGNMAGKIKCDFDLNVNAFSEDFDCAMNPIPINPVDLSTPIATSDFCPASLLMALDSGKTNSGSKPKENLVEIDLNVALDPALLKELPVPYCIPSRDSSVEVSSGRAARLQLDLNSIGDDESLLSHHPQKRRRSLSPTSSSSSRNPSLRNFDLNDNLFVLDGFGPRTNSSVFTIMGSKMLVESTDDTNLARQSCMGSGLSWDAFVKGRPLMPCAHQAPPPDYGYNGLRISPASYANSNIPLMAEARSAAVIPQLISPTGPHGLGFTIQPFLTSLNCVEPSNPGLDLNSATLQMDSGKGEARSLNHFFMPAHTNMMEQPTKTTSQHPAAGLPLKRKEPDSGWDPYGFGYNQVTSWH